MATFLNQPLTFRMGQWLCAQLQNPRWSRLEVAVAWVRRSAMQHLRGALGQFLSRGGTGALSVGVDIENTSIEGLQDLLDLENEGDLQNFIYHNENPPTFHPKIYHLADQGSASLAVGSFNITEGGLFTNSEAGLLVTGNLEEAEIAAAREALAALRRTEDPCVRRLTAEFLAGLADEGYVFSEQVLRARRAASGAQRVARAQPRQVLFGRMRVDPPPIVARPVIAPRVAETAAPPLVAPRVIPSPVTAAPVVAPTEATLIARVRKVSATDRPTQVQLPMSLERLFVNGVDSVTNAVTGESHNFVRTYARGAQNTLRVELPEIRNFNDPVVRFQRIGNAILYRAYDRTSPEGREIIRSLQEGLQSDPPTTRLTKPGSPETSTWWRFI